MEDIQWTTRRCRRLVSDGRRQIIRIEGRSELNESREGTTVSPCRTGLIVCLTSANWNEAQAKSVTLRDAKINDDAPGRHDGRCLIAVERTRLSSSEKVS
jgi:hypothetical protein